MSAAWWVPTVEKYPELFGTCSRIECAEGWKGLIDNLCAIATAHLAVVPLPSGNLEWPFRFTQIKEKFGMLSVYSMGEDAYLRGCIDFAQRMSKQICETCGQPGQHQQFAGSRWLVTRCATCLSAQSNA